MILLHDSGRLRSHKKRHIFKETIQSLAILSQETEHEKYIAVNKIIKLFLFSMPRSYSIIFYEMIIII